MQKNECRCGFVRYFPEYFPRCVILFSCLCINASTIFPLVVPPADEHEHEHEHEHGPWLKVRQRGVMAAS